MAGQSGALFLTPWKKHTYGPDNWKSITDFCEETLKKQSFGLSAVYCTVLDVDVSEERKMDAQKWGITLISASRPKWSDPFEDPPAINWLLNHLIYYPGIGKLEQIGHVVALSPKTKNTASAIHESLFPSAQLYQQPSDQPVAVLFVYDVWNDEELGLTGFHTTIVKDFCQRKAKAGEILKAFSTVLDVKISDDLKKDAERCGVTLITAQRKDGIGPKDDPARLEWLLSHEIHYPHLSDLENVKYVVGYAPKTGNAAADIRNKLFPGMKLVLINHVRPESNCLQAEEYGLSEFGEKMLQMASQADLLFSIGPYIYDYFDNAYRAEVNGRTLSDIPHEEIIPQPKWCFWEKNPTQGRITQHHILTCGQIDTQEAMEKCKSIAGSIGTVANRRKAINLSNPEWKIQGVSKQAGKNEQKSFAKALKSCYVCPILQPGHSAKSLLTSLQQSHLCLPAPCYWDYSFYGLEAMAFGLPTSVDEDSHLAHFVMKHLEMHVDYCVVRIGEGKLSEKISRHLKETTMAFKNAKALKTALMNCDAITQSFPKFTSLLKGKKENKDCCKDHETKGCLLRVTLNEDMLYKRLKELEEQSKALSAKLRQVQEMKKNDVKAAWGECHQGLTCRVQTLVTDEDRCKEIQKVCTEKVGLEPTSMTTESLGIWLNILTLYSLYRVKQTCRSGSLAKAFEPLLITDEMREIAAVVGITLQLKATYDMTEFEIIENFFLDRDGGGIHPIPFRDDDIKYTDDCMPLGEDHCQVVESSKTNLEQELEEELIMGGTRVRPVIYKAESVSPLVRSLLVLDTPCIQNAQYLVEYLLALGRTVPQSKLDLEKRMLEGQLDNAKKEKETLEEQIRDLVKISDKKEMELITNLSKMKSELLKKEGIIGKLLGSQPRVEGPLLKESYLHQPKRELKPYAMAEEKTEVDDIHHPIKKDIVEPESSEIALAEPHGSAGDQCYVTQPPVQMSRKRQFGADQKKGTSPEKWSRTTGSEDSISPEAAIPAALNTEETTDIYSEKCKHWTRRILNGHKGLKFKDVRGLVFHNDKLLACDRDNSIVHLLNEDYTCEKELGSFEGQFDLPFHPQSIAVSKGNLYFILDKNNVQIVVCDENSKILEIITLPEDSEPFCIALVKGCVVVTDIKGHRVLKYSQDGQYVAEVGGQGDGQTQFKYPYFVAVNSKDVIMVSDCWNHCIKCFDSELNYLYQYGQEGNGDGQMWFILSIAIDGADDVYVCDQYNTRIAKWKSDGTWIGNLLHNEVKHPLYMAVTSAGDRIAVCRGYVNEITIFS